jgi:cell division protease FtsH
MPEEDRMSICESELKARLVFALGGRAAEKLVFNELNAGAEDDLNRVSQIARRMVTHWGMSDRLGPVAFRDSEDHPFLGKEMAEPRRYSEHTAQLIDEEISRLVGEASDTAIKMLERNRDKLDAIAKALEQSETLDEKEIEAIIGPPVSRQNGRE